MFKYQLIFTKGVNLYHNNIHDILLSFYITSGEMSITSFSPAVIPITKSYAYQKVLQSFFQPCHVKLCCCDANSHNYLLSFFTCRSYADCDHDNKLDVHQFSSAMHFIERRLLGHDIVKQNDINATQRKEAVTLPKMTMKEKLQIKEIFQYYDVNNENCIQSKLVQNLN